MARKKKQEEPGAGAPWLNTFADLMNLLLCFFVLLFASSTVDAEKYDQLVKSFSSTFSIFEKGGEGIGDGNLISNGTAQLNNLDEYYTNMGEASETNEEDETDPLSAYQEKLEEVARENYDNISKIADKKNLDDYIDIGIDENNQFIRISLSGAVLFDSGKVDIKKNAIPILSKVGDILKKYSDAQIVIEGHTDNIPISNANYKNNLWLSTARACTVYEYFINEKGLDPRKLESSGRSEFDPIASNKTEDGRAKNRRVEIKIYNEVKE
ncbi:chemotaxis protein MotB [Mobilisporobacter senegalensis]|uniref:Chemotaxis protein MotB n=1 Tax=Mobilisporobacter senegalensis TaxID=1329262 RepID=A0A3N1XVZ9_9FIRM|nr:flagellar motor protein MotB [Mobilisporobacter senegalensis]ROR30773.1 chemotaxis protein MotB [Mobilisporobacter senegalensis]